MKTFKQHLAERAVLVKRTTKKEPTGFKEYMRSEQDLKKVIKEKYPTSKVTIQRIAELATNYKLMLADNIVIDFKSKDVWPWREYTRDLQGNGDGNTPKQMDALRASIKKEGIRDPLMLHISRMDKGVNVYLGEGNHRIGLALELGIRTVPVRFYYSGFG